MKNKKVLKKKKKKEILNEIWIGDSFTNVLQYMYRILCKQYYKWCLKPPNRTATLVYVAHALK